MHAGFAIAAALLLTAAISSNAQDAATKRDRQGPVTVTVTVMESSASGIKAKVVLDTHSVPLDGIAFDQAVSLRRPDGSDVAPVAVEQMTGAFAIGLIESVLYGVYGGLVFTPIYNFFVRRVSG